MTRRNWARRRTWHGGARRKPRPCQARPFVAPNAFLCGNLGERRGGTGRGEGPGTAAHSGNLGHAKPFVGPNPSLCGNLGPQRWRVAQEGVRATGERSRRHARGRLGFRRPGASGAGGGPSDGRAAREWEGFGRAAREGGARVFRGGESGAGGVGATGERRGRVTH
ncbi:hypothetical protein GUJ93_ZPchr0008g11931 [Zizania palustris]|uniref:Uncharacterized protein n=1 Tax=Zizania palustris TaxID=103762 RepID=A0A8J5RJT4_ZIZPA|nr:hypothetical protein GUJ93_ZPchr0008g11931 [Zizania palustris]